MCIASNLCFGFRNSKYEKLVIVNFEKYFYYYFSDDSEIMLMSKCFQCILCFQGTQEIVRNFNFPYFRTHPSLSDSAAASGWISRVAFSRAASFRNRLRSREHSNRTWTIRKISYHSKTWVKIRQWSGSEIRIMMRYFRLHYTKNRNYAQSNIRNHSNKKWKITVIIPNISISYLYYPTLAHRNACPVVALFVGSSKDSSLEA